MSIERRCAHVRNPGRSPRSPFLNGRILRSLGRQLRQPGQRLLRAPSSGASRQRTFRRIPSDRSTRAMASALGPKAGNCGGRTSRSIRGPRWLKSGTSIPDLTVIVGSGTGRILEIRTHIEHERGPQHCAFPIRSSLRSSYIRLFGVSRPVHSGLYRPVVRTGASSGVVGSPRPKLRGRSADPVGPIAAAAFTNSEAALESAAARRYSARARSDSSSRC